jgi:hypothetical protein
VERSDRALFAGVIGGLIHAGAVAQQVFGLDLRVATSFHQRHAVQAA